MAMWANRMIELLWKKGKPEDIQAHVAQANLEMRTEFARYLLSLSPTPPMNVIFTAGRLFQPEFDSFFAKSENEIILWRLISGSNSQTLEIVDFALVPKWSALRSKKWPFSTKDLITLFCQIFSLTETTATTFVTQHIIPKIQFADLLTGATFATEGERDVQIYQQLVEKGAQAVQAQQWEKAKDYWNQVKTLSQKYRWQEQEAYAQGQIMICESNLSGNNEAMGIYEDRLMLAKGYMAKGLLEKAAEIWKSIIQMCEKENWTYQKQQAEQELAKCATVSSAKYDDVLLEAGDADVLKDLETKFGPLVHTDVIGADAVAFTASERRVTGLSIRSKQMKILPDSIQKLTVLQVLDLGDNELKGLPEWIGSLSALESLTLAKNQLFDLPPSMEKLKNLKELYLWGNALTDLPPEICELTQLQRLDISKNLIEHIPSEIEKLTKLRWFRTVGNVIGLLPPKAKTALTALKSKGCDIIGIKELE
jgi:hypothetical protein